MHIPIVPTRNEDVNRKRIVFLLHFLDGCIHFAYGVAECRERILQAIWAYPVQMHIPGAEGQASSARRPNTPTVTNPRARAGEMRTWNLLP